MNHRPHTHEVKLRQDYDELGGTWRVTYGDTERRVSLWRRDPARPGFLRQMHKKAARAKTAHDKGTARAGERSRSRATAMEAVQAVNR